MRLRVHRSYDGSFKRAPKFGCYTSSAKHLLDVAKSLGLDMVGVS